MDAHRASIFILWLMPPPAIKRVIPLVRGHLTFLKSSIIVKKDVVFNRVLEGVIVKESVKVIYLSFQSAPKEERFSLRIAQRAQIGYRFSSCTPLTAKY